MVLENFHAKNALWYSTRTQTGGNMVTDCPAGLVKKDTPPHFKTYSRNQHEDEDNFRIQSLAAQAG